MLAVAVMSAPGCNRAKVEQAAQPVPKVTVTPVVSQEIFDADEYTGKTEASEIVEVRARVFGYLKTVDFKDGDYVKEGQTLFTIEPDEYEAINRQSLSRIELHTAKWELAKKKLARDAKLVKSGAVSQEEYEESAAAVDEAAAQIEAAKADANRTAVDLKYTVVEAPINGRIDRAMVSKGNLLTGGMTSGTLLTKIVNEQPMYVYFDVDERSLLGYRRQLAKLQSAAPGSLRELGLACYVKLADENDFVHEGQLDFASAEVTASSGTTRIRGVFKNTDRALASGLFVRVRIPVSKPYDALLVPERSLATDQNIKFVYVVGDDGTATRRTITLGEQRNEMRVVTAGLKSGERVIVKGLQRVRPGQKVEAELAETAPAATGAQPTEQAASREKPAAESTVSKQQPRGTTKEQ
jgi:RND family efflux transporter MFP subunit